MSDDQRWVAGGDSQSEVALAWQLHNPALTAPIIGPRTGALEALEIQLAPETMTQFDEIWPSPGEEAPKAYSW